MSVVIGVNAYHGDSSAVAVNAEGLCAGVEEERFRRVKHWAGFPSEAILHCVDSAAGGDFGAVEAIAVSRKPDAHLPKKIMLALRNPRGLARAFDRVRNMAAVSSLTDKIQGLVTGDVEVKLHRVEHHKAHVASAFFCSPFEEAACLSVDGFGDFVSTMVAHGRGSDVEVLDEVLFPHSLGLYYTAVTQYLGFPKYGDEYKVMGLAAYGEPRFVSQLRQLVPSRSNGLFSLDLTYFRHVSEGVDMSWDDGEPHLGEVFTPALEKLLGPRRAKGEEIDQRHRDIAASMQAVYEERFFALVREVMRRTGCRRLALAGGCAMNSLANGRLFDNTDVQEVFIQAAAGDAGTALGAALWVEHAVLGRPRRFVMEHAFWGPGYDMGDIRRAVADGVAGSGGADGVYGDSRPPLATKGTGCGDRAGDRRRRGGRLVPGAVRVGAQSPR